MESHIPKASMGRCGDTRMCDRPMCIGGRPKYRVTTLHQVSKKCSRMQLGLRTKG